MSVPRWNDWWVTLDDMKRDREEREPIEAKGLVVIFIFLIILAIVSHYISLIPA